MSSGGSVTHWLGELKAGDGAAAQKLWQRYFEQLVRLARAKFRGIAPRGADEEDVALSAFDSFLRGAQAGRFPQLADRDDLWRLLVLITARKAARLVRDEHRQKRGGNAMHTANPADCDADSPQLEQIVGREPTPEFAAQLTEDYERLLASLNDEQLQAVAVWKMEGFTNDEISQKLGCAQRTVERKLSLIRSIWSKEDRRQ